VFEDTPVSLPITKNRYFLSSDFFIITQSGPGSKVEENNTKHTLFLLNETMYLKKRKEK
jgi:hypothetical protein